MLARSVGRARAFFLLLLVISQAPACVNAIAPPTLSSRLRAVCVCFFFFSRLSVAAAGVHSPTARLIGTRIKSFRLCLLVF